MDAEIDFTSDMFYKIFCIFKNVIFIIGNDFPKIQRKKGVKKLAHKNLRCTRAKSFI